MLSALLLAIASLGLVIGRLEGWRLTDSLYFAFVTGRTIGYGDLVPHGGLARVLALAVGVCGILLTALGAAVAVQALSSARKEARDPLQS